MPSSKASSNCLPCTVLNLSCILPRRKPVIGVAGGLAAAASGRGLCQGAAEVPPLVQAGGCDRREACTRHRAAGAAQLLRHSRLLHEGCAAGPGRVRSPTN